MRCVGSILSYCPRNPHGKAGKEERRKKKKNKTFKSVIAAFSKILKRRGHFFTLQTDLGTEFTNKAFQSWLKQHNIHFFTTHNNKIKASIAERFIRTIQEKLWRYFKH